MPLTPGTRIGPYEITGSLGAGGMGEVYRARDTRLKREVALKILPDSFASDPDRLARFQREAEVLASLNHPHIGAIHGLEESNGIRALVLELVDGETLAERIARGPIPVDDAAQIARQIAEALQAAHEHGVVHRDLKPANIKLRPDGTAKVLDFGLAKLHAPGAPSHSNDLAPTITSPALLTGAGMLLGTAAYMSPEQAKGREADKRSDIWAFGCVLFEMLAGRRPFDGEDVSDTLANILKTDPDWSALPAETPPALGALLQTCLTKDRRHRVADMSTALFVLDKGLNLAAPAGTAAVSSRSRTPMWSRVAALTGVALVAAAITAVVVWFATRPLVPSVVRTTTTTSGSTAFVPSDLERDVAITPDGSRIVYRGNNQLLVRSLDLLEPTVLSRLGGRPRSMFVSPDGLWVAFFDGSVLKKVAITGGPPVTITSVDGQSRGGTWGPDGTIIFATSTRGTGLQRVSAAGGEPTTLTTPDRAGDARDHLWPEFLPGGEAVLFTILLVSSSIDDAQIAVLDLRSGTSKVLIRGGSDARYAPTGHLIYGISGTLRAVAFDLRRLEVTGTPVPVLEGLLTTEDGAAQVAIAGNGSLVYVPGTARGGGQQTVVSMDRQGRAQPLPGVRPDSYRDVRVSPDGARLALATQADVWTYDFMRATLTRLTTAAASDRSPLWTPDGERIIFTSVRAGSPELFRRPADGTGRDERLLTRPTDLVDLFASGWSPDGRQLLFTEVPPNLECAIGQMAIEFPSDANIVMRSGFCNAHASVSPDGRWIAYRSRVSGRDEIYVERYPELGDRQQISTDGGTIPLWSRDGRELFFGSFESRQMFAVALQPGTTFVAGRPQALFELGSVVGAVGRSYDIAPDGRFLLIRGVQPEIASSSAAEMIVVLNWLEELKRLVPGIERYNFEW
jgi:Tol biopolymer transport system component